MVAFRNGVKFPSFKTTFTTPAIASEPYCADAPSRNTSMRSIAAAGIVFMSTPDEPAGIPYANVFMTAV